MIAGEPAPQMAEFQLPNLISNPTTIFNSGPAHLTGLQFPADTPGFISYLQDDAWSGAITEDHLKVWEIDIDFNDINSSTISIPQEIPLDNFDSFFVPFGVGEIDQPGTGQDLAGIGGVISYASNYRAFEDHNSWLITFNVDIDGNLTSGIRWIELRNTAADSQWTLHQEGTFAPDDGNSRFMSSGGIDERGNIGIAYSLGGANTPVSLSYTGRFEDDPLGQLTVAETTIVAGNGVQTFSNRYGDYAQLTMDPDNLTFWYTSQYFEVTNTWTTRITSFRLADDLANDLGVTSIITPNDGLLTNSEVVEIEIRNFGLVAQSNFPVSLFLDNNLVATETFTGTINPLETSTYTFTQTLDLSIEAQTYMIRAGTELSTDEFLPNNDFEKEVTHTFSDDIGIVEITSPGDSEPLGLKTITVVVENFGGIDQSNFDVTYSFNGDAPVAEQVTGVTLALGEQTTFNFATQVNFDSTGAFTIDASTNLTADQDTSNDTLTKNILITSCLPTATGGNGGVGCSVDGIKRFVLNTIIADNGQDGCNTEPEDGPNGYADRTNLSTDLSNQAGGNVHNLRAQTNWDDGVGVEVLSAWVDFNDNAIFEPSEQLIAGVAFQVVDTLDDFELIIPEGSPLGPHVLRVKAIDGSATGDINNPCTDYDFGETHDYTVNIVSVLGTDVNQLPDSDLIVESIDNRNFDITLTTQVDSNIYVAVYSPLGQELKYKKVRKDGDAFKLALNMEAVPAGVYFVKLIAIDQNTFRTARILVK